MTFAALRIVVLIGVGFVLGHVSEAVAATSDKVQETVICKSPGKIAGNTSDALVGKSASAGKAVRTLRLYGAVKNENGESGDGCRATYSKTNVEQVVGTSRQIQTCQSILSGIQKNLEASSWSCRKVGAMAVLKSNAAESSEAMAKPEASSVQ